MAGTTSTALELRDIHLPDPVSWWPLAPGWWILLALILVITVAIFLYRQYRKKQALKKQLMVEFEIICHRFKKEKNSTELVQSLSTLLRRACISFYPRSEVASLTGEAWLQFLDDTAHEKLFNTGHGKIISTAPYLSEDVTPYFDAEKLITLCNQWLKTQPDKDHIMAGKKP